MKLRMYCIVNQYIAGIHAGIQSAHAIHEMFLRYPQRFCQASNQLWDWASEDKTIIVLNGGYQSKLYELYGFASTCEDIPISSFKEEQDSLNGALTAIAMVLPEYIYDPQYCQYMIVSADSPSLNGPVVADTWKNPETGVVEHHYSEEEKLLIGMLKKLRLKGE